MASPPLDPYAPPAAPTAARPRVIGWFRAYAAAVAMIHLLIVGAATMSVFAIEQGLATSTGGPDPKLVLFVSLVLAAFHAFAARVPLEPWGWTVGLVALALGVAGCTFFVALPLLLHWRKPLTKAAFRRPPI